MDRICFSCPGCNIRRKTYKYNQFLRIRCPVCGYIFIVSEGKDIRYRMSKRELEEKHDEIFEQKKEKFNIVAFMIWQILIWYVFYLILKQVRPDLFL